MNNTVPSSEERIGRESTPDSTTYDRQIGPGEKEEVADSHRVDNHCL